MMLDEIREKLQDRNLKVIAEKIGVHYNTIYKIASGDTTVKYSTILKLSEYLKG